MLYTLKNGVASLVLAMTLNMVVLPLFAVNHCVSDGDGDGLCAGEELCDAMYVHPNRTGTCDNNTDFDDDSLSDFAERNWKINNGPYVNGNDTGTNPLVADTDTDGLNDNIEWCTGVFVDIANTGTCPTDTSCDDCDATGPRCMGTGFDCVLANDFDGDADLDGADNCPLTANSNQADNDGDGVGDACDSSVALLFDTSGSMSWRVDGTSPAPSSEQRITLAQNAAHPFLELLNIYAPNIAQFGISTFPAQPAMSPWPCDAAVKTEMTSISPTTKDMAITTTVPGLLAVGPTPLLAGVTTTIGMFGPEQHKAIVLLSDGYHNCPSTISVDDTAFTDLVTQLDDIKVFAIGFGLPSDMDNPLLSALAEQTGGAFYNVTGEGTFDPDNPTTWNPAPDLDSTYKNILQVALELESGTDPLDTISAGATKRYEIRLNEHDRRASFLVSWQKQERRRLTLTVTNSNGDSVVPTSPGVQLAEGATYTILTIEGSYLAQPGTADSTPWSFEVSPAGLTDGEIEPFQYSVILDSGLKFRPGFDSVSYATGDTMTLTAHVKEAGGPLVGLSDVEVVISAPGDGKGNWLAKNAVTELELDQVPKMRGVESFAPFMRKAFFLTDIRGLSFPGPRSPRVLKLHDDGSHGDATADDGIYTNRFTDTGNEGVYSFHFRASGPTKGGNGFDRDRIVQKYISVNVAANSTPIVAALLRDTTDGKQFDVKLTPKDTLGNFLGPGHSSLIRFVSTTGTFIGTLRDNLDGSYAQTISLSTGVDEFDADVTVIIRQVETTFNLGRKARHIGFSFHAGRTNPVGSFGNLYDPGTNFGLDLDIPLRSRLSLVTTLQYNSFNSVGASTPDTHWWSVSPNLKYALVPDTLPTQFQPFISGGPGVYIPESGSSELGYNLGIGVDKMVNQNWTFQIGIDYHDISVSGSDIEFWVLRTGLIYRR